MIKNPRTVATTREPSDYEELSSGAQEGTRRAPSRALIGTLSAGLIIVLLAAGAAYLSSPPTRTATITSSTGGPVLGVTGPVEFTVNLNTHRFRSIRSVIIMNPGDGPLTLMPTRINSFVHRESTATFSVAHDCPAHMDPHTTCRVDLAFVTTLPGRRAGHLVVSDTAGHIATADLVGEGLQ